VHNEFMVKPRSLDLVPNPYDLQRGDVCRYPIRVFLAHPENIIMWGLKTLLQQYARHIQVVGEAFDLNTMRDQLLNSKATVVILDIVLLSLESLPVLTDVLNHCHAQILLMADHSDDWLKREAIANGVRGLVEKSDPPEKLFRGIESLHNGDTWLNPIWLANSARQFSAAYAVRREMTASDRIASLTKCELLTVLTMYKYAREKNHVVADALNISPATLRNRLSIIYEKLNVSGKAGLILFVLENGLVPS
jgi:DNA-binding NarL/FixJ family response regulator